MISETKNSTVVDKRFGQRKTHKSTLERGSNLPTWTLDVKMIFKNAIQALATNYLDAKL